jgi:hypothetical protein
MMISSHMFWLVLIRTITNSWKTLPARQRSRSTLYSQLLVAEARLELQHASQYQSSSSMNFASRGRGGGRGGFGHRFGGCGEPVSSSAPKPVCQLCKKTGHTVLQCWKHFDRNYTGEDKSVNNADGPGYNVDPAWYSDTGATDRITSKLDKLVVREKYSGPE